MIQNYSESHPSAAAAHAASSLLSLPDFGKLQDKYQSLSIAARAHAVLGDSAAVIEVALGILGDLSTHPKMPQALVAIRSNAALIGKMRHCEAKSMLLDESTDFIDATVRKLLSWQKTMERISHGEGIAIERSGEYISERMPVAGALISAGGTDNYLAVIQLLLTELARIDSRHAAAHRSNLAKIRRCATLISDYDNAASLRGLVH